MNQPSTAFSDIDASAITKAAAVYTTATVAGPIRWLMGWVVAEKGNDGNLQMIRAAIICDRQVRGPPADGVVIRRAVRRGTPSICASSSPAPRRSGCEGALM